MTSSSRFGEDVARAGAAPTPPEPLHGPTHYFAGAAARPTDVGASVMAVKQQDSSFLIHTAARTPNLQHRIDELVLALALVDAENNALRRQLAAMARTRDTWMAEVMAG